jgi:hypothetical protein
MRMLYLLTCLALASGCSSLGVRCDSRLRQINQPDSVHVTDAARERAAHGPRARALRSAPEPAKP